MRSRGNSARDRYGGHRAPRDHTISFQLLDEHGQFRSNVIWLLPEHLRELTAENIRWLVERSNGKFGKPR
jgi:hypothetical protein